ncbi:MAG: alpha/beta fold hydrolase [Pseudomonadota bacterium]
MTTLTETATTVILEPDRPAAASVLWLHGLGADGHDFVPIVAELGLPTTLAARFVFPRAPYRPVTINGGYEMRAWYDICSLSAAERADPTGLAQSVATVHALIEDEIARGIPSSKIIVAGFSQGGAVALHAGCASPRRLAGIMALSTYLPLPQQFCVAAHAANVALPILQCHGLNDSVVTISMGTAARDVLRAAGYPVEWQALAMEHEVSFDEVRLIAKWLLDRLS